MANWNESPHLSSPKDAIKILQQLSNEAQDKWSEAFSYGDGIASDWAIVSDVLSRVSSELIYKLK